MTLRYGSVCSGIEAASQAWHPLGWEPVFFSEIEPFPCAVLAHRYGSNLPGEVLAAGGVPNLGDMTQFREWPDYAIDLLVGGTPCQDYSVAGLRKGLAGDRGRLTLTFVEILRRYRPRWFIWENVPGVFSTNGGRDFARFLGDLSGQTVSVPNGGWKNAGIVTGSGGIGAAYGLAWRVLDTQFTRTCLFPFALPQRRRRVFVVGYLGDWRRAAAVLFDRESLCGHPAPGRQAGQAAAHDVAAGLVGSGRGVDRAGETRGQDPVVGVRLAFGGNNTSGPISAAAALNAHGGPSGRQDFETETFVMERAPAPIRAHFPDQDGQEGLLVAHALRGEGFDAS